MSTPTPHPQGSGAGPRQATSAAAASARLAGAPQRVDARGISAPLPVLRAHRALRVMAPGQLLQVVTTYPESVAEFQALVKHVPGYELVEQEELGGEFFHLLRRRR